VARFWQQCHWIDEFSYILHRLLVCRLFRIDCPSKQAVVTTVHRSTFECITKCRPHFSPCPCIAQASAEAWVQSRCFLRVFPFPCWWSFHQCCVHTKGVLYVRPTSMLLSWGFIYDVHLVEPKVSSVTCKGFLRWRLTFKYCCFSGLHPSLIFWNKVLHFGSWVCFRLQVKILFWWVW
jgi:hypothetical protein